MYKRIIPLLTLIIISSCSKKADCNGTDEKKLLIETLKSELSKKSESIKNELETRPDLKLNISDVDSLINDYLNYLELINIRTLKIDKDVNLCHCNTGFKLRGYEDFYEILIRKGHFNLGNDKDKERLNKIKEVFEKEFKVDYNVQYTEDKKLFLEMDKNQFINNSIMRELFGMYVEMKGFDKRTSINQEVKNESVLNFGENTLTGRVILMDLTHPAKEELIKNCLVLKLNKKVTFKSQDNTGDIYEDDVYTDEIRIYGDLSETNPNKKYAELINKDVEITAIITYAPSGNYPLLANIIDNFKYKIID